MKQLKDKWQFLYWTSEEEWSKDDGMVLEKYYKGTLLQAIKKFRNFMATHEVFNIDEEVKRCSDGKCFSIRKYSDDDFFGYYI